MLDTLCALALPAPRFWELPPLPPFAPCAWSLWEQPLFTTLPSPMWNSASQLSLIQVA